MNKKLRIVTLIMAMIMLLSVVVGALGMMVKAADIKIDADITSIKVGSSFPVKLTTTTYNIVFKYYEDISVSNPIDEGDIKLSTTDKGYTLDSVAGAFRSAESLKLKVSLVSSSVALIEGTLTNVQCVNPSHEALVLKILPGAKTKAGKDYTGADAKVITASTDAYFDSIKNNNSGGTGTTSDSTTFSSDIVVENVMFLDSSGNRIDVVTKDSPAFTVEVLYADIGLRKAELEGYDLKDDADMSAYITNSTGFKPGSSNKGTVKLASTSDEYPRFRATFRNITFDGSSNTFSFRVQYIIEDMDIKGETSVTAYQAKLKSEEDDKDKIAPPTPYIIINQYSYGGEPIEAGTQFNLDISFKNTSEEIPLENIVMTVTPPEDLSVAAASNTIYLPSLAEGAAMGHSIALYAKPSAKVGSHSVQIEFTYQYIANKERKENKKSENIAIPVTQIDRFSVDPITELSEFVQVGEEALITVSFINRGKSTTSNISGMIAGGDNYSGQSQHFGNLEPGKSDSLDFSIIPTAPGVINGEVVIQYEDESTNLKEFIQPFSITVAEPYIPPPEPPMDPNLMEPLPQFSLFTIILSALGGLLIAVPIALYLIKRVKAKGSEELDEDF